MSGLKYRAEIDGLRAIAVLAVVAFHAQAPMPAGFVGVDVFFVISGYLISALLLREQSETGRISLTEFYARRTRRILPAALSVIVAVLSLSWLLLPPKPLAEAAASSVASIAFVGNFFFQAHSGYFDGRAEEMPLLHLWSLSVEEQFYLIWPLLLLGLLRLGRAWLRTYLAFLAASSLLVSELLLRSQPEAAFFQMPSRFWELAVGGWIAASPAAADRRFRWLAPAGLLLVVGSLFVRSAHFPGLGALPTVLGTSLLLLAIHRGEPLGATGWLLQTRPLVFVGLVSYSLYLWHWPLLAFYRATSIGDGQYAVRLALCAFGFALAVASYRLVETPLRKKRWSAPRTIGLGLAAAAGVALSGGMLALWQSSAETPSEAAASFAEGDMPANRARCHYLKQDTANQIPRSRCESVLGIVPSVAIWGDSTALAWQPLAWQVARNSGRSAIGLSRDACPPLADYVPAPGNAYDRACAQFNALALAQIDRYDTVVLSARWNKHFQGESREKAVAALRRSLARLSPGVRRIIVVGPTPELRDLAPRCIRYQRPDLCAVPRAEFERSTLVAREELERLVAEFPNAEYFDPTGYLCTGDQCPPVREGTALYWDELHVSTTAAIQFARDYLDRRR